MSGHLVLTRKPGETILIGDGEHWPISFTISQVSGLSVRIAVKAPKDLVILRDELLLRGNKGVNNGQAGNNRQSVLPVDQG